MSYWLPLVTLRKGRGYTMITMDMSRNTQLSILSDYSIATVIKSTIDANQELGQQQACFLFNFFLFLKGT